MPYIKQLKSGKWLCRVTLGGRHNCVQKSKTFRTRKLADKWGREIRDAFESGKPLDESNMTLGEYLKLWLESVARKKVRHRTHQSYKLLLERHVIKQAVGMKSLSKVSTIDVQSIYDKMEASGLSPRSVHYLHTVLKSAMAYALDTDLIAKNVCSNPRITLPAQVEKEIIVLDQEEVSRFVSACQEINNGLILEVAVELGARVSEYLALKWQDLDFTDNVVKINRTVFHPSGGNFEFSAPKTKSGNRTIPFSDSLRERLIEHKRKQNENRLKSGYDSNPLNLVFCTSAGTPYRIENVRNRIFKPALAKADIRKPMVLKNLRHTSASLLVRAGHNPKIVQMRLGHSDISTTLRFYTQFAAEQQVAAVADLDKLMRAKR